MCFSYVTFKHGILHSLPIVLASLGYLTQSFLPFFTDSVHIISNQNIHTEYYLIKNTG